jgi:hypothetical protein
MWTASGSSTSLGKLASPKWLGLMLTAHASPNNDVRLATAQESPVLARGGFKNQFEETGNPVPTMEEWTFAKQKWQRTKNVSRDDVAFATAKILPGFNERIYA